MCVLYAFPSFADNYTCDCWDFASYPRPRAASEFGWQSYSSLPSLAELVEPSEWSWWSPSILRRDTHPSQPPETILFKNVGDNWRVPGYDPRGASPLDPVARTNRLTGRASSVAATARAANATSRAYLQRPDGSFILPTDALGIPAMLAGAPGGVVGGATFFDQVLLSQFSHAACLATEAEHYRRSQSDATGGGGGTMVSLYWMAADFWPGATKGSIEWSGRWKATHYAAKNRFHSPFIVSVSMRPLNATGLTPAETPLSVHVAAHAPADGPVPSGLVELTCWSWGQSAVLGRVDAPFSVGQWPAWPPGSSSGVSAGGTMAVWNSTLAATLAACGAGASALADVVVSVAAYNGSTAADPLLARNWLFPVSLNKVTTMRDPGLAISDVVGVPGSPGAFDVVLRAQNLPVAAVWLESLLCCGSFDDNAFLLTESPRTIRYTPRADARGWAHAPAPGSETLVSEGQFAASLSVVSLADTANYAP